MKPIRINFVGNATDEWKILNSLVAEEKSKGIENSENQRLFKSIKQKIEFLRTNPQYGDAVPKKLIPKKIPVDNLWVVDLVSFWRMLYTLRNTSRDSLFHP
jgi:hypothetical protein